jgi:hypothetical protein
LVGSKHNFQSSKRMFSEIITFGKVDQFNYAIYGGTFST